MRCPFCGNEINVEQSNYKPISMWGYFGYELLFSIPLVGFILLIVFSFSDSNINLRNFARSYFCFLIIAVILTAIIIAMAGGIGAIAMLADR